MLSEVMNSDLIEIRPVIPYTDEDLNWNDSNSRSSMEMQNLQTRPAIEDINNISEYDTIFIGYPIWWGTYPREINTLIDKYDFTRKTIIPFCTSGGTDISESINDFKASLPNSNILNGQKLNIDNVESFVKSLGISNGETK